MAKVTYLLDGSQTEKGRAHMLAKLGNTNVPSSSYLQHSQIA